MLWRVVVIVAVDALLRELSLPFLVPPLLVPLPCLVSYPVGHEQVHTGTAMPATWATEFHEYAMEHDKSHLAYVIDGVTVLNVSTDDAAAPLFWPMPFYLILNTAVGGSWPGEPNATTTFPTYHVIDYVKVTQFKG